VATAVPYYAVLVAPRRFPGAQEDQWPLRIACLPYSPYLRS
jgi:hypothetical protein